jgi:DNA-binding FadR family transcriptional regulator
MATLLLRSHQGRRELVGSNPAIKQYLIEDHRLIFQAVIGRDEENADQVLRRHFRIGDEYRREAEMAAKEIPPRPAINLTAEQA